MITICLWRQGENISKSEHGMRISDGTHESQGWRSLGDCRSKMTVKRQLHERGETFNGCLDRRRHWWCWDQFHYAWGVNDCTSRIRGLETTRRLIWLLNNTSASTPPPPPPFTSTHSKSNKWLLVVLKFLAGMIVSYSRFWELIHLHVKQPLTCSHGVP